jgi:arsenate reductase-like glutaredoxin family protein
LKLIEKNKEKLLEKFEEFKFDADDIINILESSDISKSIKQELIEQVDYDLIANKTIANLIYKYVDKTVIKSSNYTKKMLEYLENLESKINLIIEQKSEFNDEELMELLSLLPSEYQKIANQDGKQITLDNTNYNREFIKLLQEYDLITTSKNEKNNKIRLYIKKR